MCACARLHRKEIRMFDDLRNSAITSIEEEAEMEAAEPTQPVEVARPPFLGMTAPQRFVLALLVFFMILIFAAFLLVLTEKIVLPFY
jgi:hypothetical protein